MSKLSSENITSVDFSSQYGGKDSFKVVRPHFRFLKNASKELELQGFPVRELVFILRVSGEIQSYDGEGLDLYDYNKKENYLSIDVVVGQKDWLDLQSFFCSALYWSEDYLSDLVSKGEFPAFDVSLYAESLKELLNRYNEEVMKQKRRGE